MPRLKRLAKIVAAVTPEEVVRLAGLLKPKTLVLGPFRRAPEAPWLAVCVWDEIDGVPWSEMS